MEIVFYYDQAVPTVGEPRTSPLLHKLGIRNGIQSAHQRNSFFSSTWVQRRWRRLDDLEDRSAVSEIGSDELNIDSSQPA
jgi:hypothetical protein